MSRKLVVYSATGTPLPLTEYPFFLDTRAATHITAKHSNFELLHPITPYPISSIGGSHIYTVGKGTVKICIPNGMQLTLDNILFISKSKVCLISILILNCSGQYLSHFSSNSFWLTHKNDTIVLLCSTIHENHQLYILNLHNTSNSKSKPYDSKMSLTVPTPSAFYILHTLDVETWHQYLGHCNSSTIVNMA